MIHTIAWCFPLRYRAQADGTYDAGVDDFLEFANTGTFATSVAPTATADTTADTTTVPIHSQQDHHHHHHTTIATPTPHVADPDPATPRLSDTAHSERVPCQVGQEFVKEPYHKIRVTKPRVAGSESNT